MATLDGAFARLRYLEELFEPGEGFCHWGMERVHGREAARTALRDAYRKQAGELVARDIRGLWQEWSREEGSGRPAGINAVRAELGALRARHLSLVFETLSALAAAHPPKQAA